MVDLSLQAVCGVTTVNSWPLGEQLLHPYPLHLVTWCVCGGGGGGGTVRIACMRVM